MSTVLSYVCDYCGAVVDSSSNELDEWFVLEIDPKTFFRVIAYPSYIERGRPTKHICSQCMHQYFAVVIEKLGLK